MIFDLKTSAFASSPLPGQRPASEQPSISSHFRNGSRTVPELEVTDTSDITPEGFSGLILTDDVSHAYVNRNPMHQTDIEEAIPAEDRICIHDVQHETSIKPTAFPMSSQPTIRKQSLNTIDNDLIKELKLPIPRGGYLKTFKAGGELVNVRFATNTSPRKQQIQAGCQKQELNEVEVHSIFSKNPEKVAKLVELELQNFLTEPASQQGLSSEALEQGYSRWFTVPENVAFKSIQLWRDFVDQAYNSEGSITDYWARRMASLPTPGPLEVIFYEKGLKDNTKGFDEYQWLRHSRYMEWVTDGQRSDTRAKLVR